MSLGAGMLDGKLHLSHLLQKTEMPFNPMSHDRTCHAHPFAEAWMVSLVSV